jgi:hypothetical protein
MKNLIKIKKTNLIEIVKNEKYYFKQITDNIETKIILESSEKGFIGFYIKSKNNIFINNKIIKNGYINLKNTVIIKSINKSNNNYIKIKNINFFHENEYNLFDFEFYRNNNDNLKVIKNNYELWCHWCQFGKNESKSYLQINQLKNNNEIEIEKDFNWKQYIDNYKDLRDAGIVTKEKAIEHWINYGKNEKRHYYSYDINYFKKIYITEKFNDKLNFLDITKIEPKSNDNFIDEKKVLITKHYNKLDFKPEKINIEYLNHVENFILVVDFFNGGGGTTQFINNIISNYKMYKIFVIVRNYSKKIVFTINDEYEINENFDNDTSIQFLHEIKNKIEKIFINHTLGHDVVFLNELFKLNKEIITITHDFYLINDDPNPMIHNINNNYSNEKKININLFNKIITQNIKNLSILNNHITNKNIPIVITDLPDYRETLDLVKTSNEKIIIGIFGAISEIKGLHILKDIVKNYKNNNSVEIIVFGLCYIANFKNQYIYHSIQELNELLVKFKPNILIELSIVPETYSYTLSLKMITKLPIIYFKKTGNFVVEDRLSKYDKAYPFETFDEFDELIKLHKQNYFYTIKPVIYFNHFWDKYFNNLKNRKNKL